MIMVILSFYIIDRKIFYIGILDITGILSRKIYIQLGNSDGLHDGETFFTGNLIEQWN